MYIYWVNGGPRLGDNARISPPMPHQKERGAKYVLQGVSTAFSLKRLDQAHQYVRQVSDQDQADLDQIDNEFRRLNEHRRAVIHGAWAKGYKIDLNAIKDTP